MKERCYWRILTDRDRKKEKYWEEMRLHHVYRDKKNGWHQEKEERREAGCVCVFVQSASFAAVQGVVCHVCLLNLSLEWQLLFVWRRSEHYWVLNKSSLSLILLKIARGVSQTCESSRMHSIERVSLWWIRSSMCTKKSWIYTDLWNSMAKCETV